MSADKDPIRSAHETLALIADKLSIERSSGGDISAPATPIPPVAVPQPPAPTPPQAAAAPPFQPSPPATPVQTAFDSSTSPAAPTPSPVAPTTKASLAASAWQRPPVREAVLTYFPMAIAVLSLVLSIYQGFLFHESLKISHESIDIMQRNVARGEFSRACRDIIETYFQVKQRVGVLMPASDRGNVAGASRVTEVNRLEAQAAIAKFGGLGTYLANFQDEATRARYTELTRTLTAIMDIARTTQLSEIDKLFVPAEKLFGQMNEDCARLSRTMRM
jgi:hypothetical protein